MSWRGGQMLWITTCGVVFVEDADRAERGGYRPARTSSAAMAAATAAGLLTDVRC